VEVWRRWCIGEFRKCRMWVCKVGGRPLIGNPQAEMNIDDLGEFMFKTLSRVQTDPGLARREGIEISLV
jgi:hypothetical protein